MFLSEIGAIGGVVRGTTELLRELKKPKLSGDQFAEMLKLQMAQKNSPEAAAAQKQQQMKQVDALSTRFIELRDADGDGLLSKDESGMAADEFEKLDINDDDQISKLEVARGYWLRAGLKPPEEQI